MKKLYLLPLLLSIILTTANAQSTVSRQVPAADSVKKEKMTLYINAWLGYLYNSTFGGHGLVDLTVGLVSHRNYYYLVWGGALGKSRHSYFIHDNDSLKAVDAYRATYYSFEYQRVLIYKPKTEFSAIIGVGSDYIHIEADDNIKVTQTYGAFAINAGLGYAYYFKGKHGLVLEALYHYANFRNYGDSRIDPNAMLLRITYSGRVFKS